MTPLPSFHKPLWTSYPSYWDRQTDRQVSFFFIPHICVHVNALTYRYTESVKTSGCKSSEPSCSYYYLLSPNILFLHILFVLHFWFYCTFYSLFLFFYHIFVLCYFYIFLICILLHCPLSGPDLIYISLLIIPCIIYYVTNKETLNLEPWSKGTEIMF